MSVEEHQDEHHLPAVEDWPRGFGEASWWPFVTAIGATGFYLGAALYVLGTGQNPVVPPLTGPAVFVGATFVFLFGLYGWVYHAFVSHFWSEGTHERSANALRWGMLLFLGSEIATFGAGFTYYFYIRSGAWPPAAAEMPDLLSSIILVNTAILVASSFTLHWAHVQLRRGNHDSFTRWLAVTLLFGVVFLGGQVYEYYEFIVHQGFTIEPGAPMSIFASAFFGLTGLHGLHVTLGAVLLGVLLVRALIGQYSAEKHVSVSTISMYWHFVDAVWLFLVVVLYVGASVSL